MSSSDPGSALHVFIVAYSDLPVDRLCRHPNIAQVFGVCRSPNLPAIIFHGKGSILPSYLSYRNLLMRIGSMRVPVLEYLHNIPVQDFIPLYAKFVQYSLLLF